MVLVVTFLLWGWLGSPILAEETAETVTTEQSITTGEAVAEVVSNNEINENLSVTEGTVDGCQLEINCSNQNNNNAVVV